MPLCAEPAAARRNRRRVREIYLASFPREERMPFFLMCLLAKMPQTQFLAFREGEQVCGFAYMAVLDGMAFLLFLAVDPALRSRGYGSAILRGMIQVGHELGLTLLAEGVESLAQARALC